MSAAHDRLGFTLMGLGLVRLLQDAKRFEEAREVLYALDDGFKGGAEKSAKASRTPCRTKPAKLRMLRVFAA
jgi:hypothetical protein